MAAPVSVAAVRAAAKKAGVDVKELLATINASKTKIASLDAREILDSRGNPTIEVDLLTEGGISVRAAVPSGASTGIHEACELRDGDKARYLGKGVLKAIASVKEILNKELKGFDVTQQEALDKKMIEIDGTPNKSKLGANAILGVSLAAAKAGAEAKNIPLYRHFADLAGNKGPMVLPLPCFNVINGGSHAGNKLAFQEYFIIPVGADSFVEAMRIGAECYHTLKGILKKKYGGDATLVGDEGGFAPPCDAREGVELIMEAIDKAGYKGKCKIGMDVAASEFKVEGQDCYDLGTWYPEAEKGEAGLKMTGKELAEFYAGLCNEFPLITIEDPFDQDDWEAWKVFTELVGKKHQVVGDDLTVTNVERVQRAIDEKSCNALLLKVNQIGTVTESIDAVKLCKRNGWGVMTSHRSGETEDTTIADLAVGLCTGQIKTGAPCRSDRNAKYNQLMRIEEELGSDAVFAGKTWRRPAWMAKEPIKRVVEPIGEETVKARMKEFEDKFNANDIAGAAATYAQRCFVTVNGGKKEGGPFTGRSRKEVEAFLGNLRNEMGATNIKFTVTETSGISHKDTWTSDAGTGACEAQWRKIKDEWLVVKDAISFTPKA